MKAANVNAVHEDDTETLLDLLGVGIDYHAGRLGCVICGSPLKDAGLAAARRGADGEYEFVCDRLDCQDDFHAS